MVEVVLSLATFHQSITIHNCYPASTVVTAHEWGHIPPYYVTKAQDLQRSGMNPTIKDTIWCVIDAYQEFVI